MSLRGLCFVRPAAYFYIAGLIVARLVDRIIEKKIKRLSVIGLAKNTGKTVTFNTLVAECRTVGLKPALISFGRDGESVDAITLLEKPRIHVPPNTLFVTAERFINPAVIDIKSETGTGLFTVFGETKVYTSGSNGGMAELIGVNTVAGLLKIIPLLERQSDLVLIDGALDRRSSAVPLISDACILSTGAVLGMTEDDVVRHTEEAVSKLKVPELDDPDLVEIARSLFVSQKSGCITDDGSVLQAGNADEAISGLGKENSVRAVVLSGALTDKRAEQILNSDRGRDLSVIIKDSTRLFLNSRLQGKMEKKGISLRVLDSVNTLAITVNPTRPFFSDMDSKVLVSSLRKKFPEYLCYNILSEEYIDQ